MWILQQYQMSPQKNMLSHDDVTKWKHFLRYWLFVRGIHRSPVSPPHKGQWHRALILSLICAWINGLVKNRHYDDVIMSAIASQITSLTIVYSIVYSEADQRKHQGSASLAFVWGIHRGPVNSPHKWPVTRKMFPFDDVIMVRLAIWYPIALRSLWRPCNGDYYPS